MCEVGKPPRKRGRGEKFGGEDRRAEEKVKKKKRESGS